MILLQCAAGNHWAEGVSNSERKKLLRQSLLCYNKTDKSIILYQKTNGTLLLPDNNFPKKIYPCSLDPGMKARLKTWKKKKKKEFTFNSMEFKTGVTLIFANKLSNVIRKEKIPQINQADCNFGKSQTFQLLKQHARLTEGWGHGLHSWKTSLCSLFAHGWLANFGQVTQSLWVPLSLSV